MITGDINKTSTINSDSFRSSQKATSKCCHYIPVQMYSWPTPCDCWHQSRMSSWISKLTCQNALTPKLWFPAGVMMWMYHSAGVNTLMWLLSSSVMSMLPTESKSISAGALSCPYPDTFLPNDYIKLRSTSKIWTLWFLLLPYIHNHPWHRSPCTHCNPGDLTSLHCMLWRSVQKKSVKILEYILLGNLIITVW